MRCANQHFVPAGFSYCRRCEDSAFAAGGHTASVATSTLDSSVLTLGEYAARRTRLVAVNAGAAVVTATFLTVPSTRSLLLTTIIALIAAAAAAAVARSIDPRSKVFQPASAAQARMLDRLMLLPLGMAVVVAIVALAR